MDTPAIACPCCGSKVAQSWVWDVEGGILVTKDGSTGPLHPQERTVLDVLLRSRTRVTHKDHLINALYGEMDEPGNPERLIDVLICRLRKAIRPLGMKIVTHYGRGYRLESAEVPS